VLEGVEHSDECAHDADLKRKGGVLQAQRERVV